MVESWLEGAVNELGVITSLAVEQAAVVNAIQPASTRSPAHRIRSPPERLDEEIRMMPPAELQDLGLVPKVHEPEEPDHTQ